MFAHIAALTRRIAHAVLAAQIGHFRARIPFPDDRYDLLFAELRFLHKSSPMWKTLLPDGPVCQGVTHGFSTIFPDPRLISLGTLEFYRYGWQYIHVFHIASYTQPECDAPDNCVIKEGC